MPPGSPATLAAGSPVPATPPRAGWRGWWATWRPPPADRPGNRPDPHAPGRPDPDGATRLVSLHDPDARPILKGRLGKPVEFGDKAQVLDNPDRGRAGPRDPPWQSCGCAAAGARGGAGHPADRPGARGGDRRPQLRRGRDRRGVAHPWRATGGDPPQGPAQPGSPGQEHTRSFRRLVKWRTGSEGRISHLKHGYGWDRTLMDGIDGARIWCGHGVLAHNLVKISGLVAAKQQQRAA
jgi:IS5 family transposase